MLGKIYSVQECDAVAQTAHGVGVHRPWGCSEPWGRGIKDVVSGNSGGGLGSGLGILEVLSNLNDSVML